MFPYSLQHYVENNILPATFLIGLHLFLSYLNIDILSQLTLMHDTHRN